MFYFLLLKSTAIAVQMYGMVVIWFAIKVDELSRFAEKIVVPLPAS